MTVFRRHLRSWSTAWLICQAVALSAFAPQSCCLAHRTTDPAHAGHTEHCADASIPAESCPMRKATGEACPMHSQLVGSVGVDEHAGHAAEATDPGARTHPAPPAPPAQDACAMRGICNGPGVAIASLFPLPAVLADDAVGVVDPLVATLTLTVVSLPNAPVPPDTPPPRA